MFESVLDGLGVTHELGHVLQEQLFEQDFVNDNCGTDGWSPASTEFQSCATQEGWACYVADVSWWDPGNKGSAPFYGTFQIEDSKPYYNGASQCALNAALPGQIARAFWDLDDDNNEIAFPSDQNAGSPDNDSFTTASIAQGWDVFLDGDANHKDKETGNDGVNVRDYDANAGAPDTTFFNHNCLQATVDKYQ
jgi:hypothetical protein